MKTLVIHPYDLTTEFLSVIYDCKDWTIISEDKSRRELKNLIKEHDRIIMMGHGDSNGLIGHGHYVINKENRYYLAKKICIFIWCNANEFVRKMRLRGLCTGMIISEYDEALIYGINPIRSEDINESNKLFANVIGRYLEMPNRLNKIKAEYISGVNPIIQFNEKNIFEFG
jgi:hypothetical protein